MVNVIFGPALRWIRRGMVDLNDIKSPSEQNWEPEGTPKVAQGASRLNPKLSNTIVARGLTAVPGPVEGKGEVGTGLIE